MRTSNRLVGAWLALALSGCCNPPEPTDPLDRVAGVVEEYGFATISTPILSRPDERFEFALDRPAIDYFREAKSEVQGAGGYFDQVVQSFAAGVSMQFDPTQAAAYAARVQQYFRDQREVGERATLRAQIADERRDAAAARFERAKRRHEEELARASQIEDPEQARNIRQAADFAFDEAHSDWIAALDAYRDEVAAESVASEYPTAPAAGGTPPPAEGVARQPVDARAVLSGERFEKFGGLLGNTAPVVSNRAAVITAAGDKAVEAIFRVLGKPEKAQAFEGRTVLFGISTVSVNPGWRTRSGFAADVNMQVAVGLQPARPETRKAYLEDERVPPEVRMLLQGGRGSVPSAYGGTDRAVFLHDPGPVAGGEQQVIHGAVTVVAVSPMTETQTLDLASSYRRRDELALRLALALRQAGLGGQAEAFEQYVHDRQRDVRTRDAIASVSSYSTGAVFGYQVGPRLTAIGDVTDEAPEAEAVLSRQTFPVLLIIGIETATAFPQLIPRPGGAPMLAEPFLQFIETKSWTPLSECAAVHRIAESALTRWSHDLRSYTADNGANRLLVSRSRQLEHKAFGSWAKVPVPVSAMFPPSTPVVTTVVPGTIELDRNATGPVAKTQRFTFVGEHLAAIDLTRIALLTGRATLAAGSAMLRDGAIQIDVIVSDGGEPLVFVLPRTDGSAGLYLPPIPVALERAAAHVARVHPDLVEWIQVDGTPTSHGIEVLLEGEHLDRIDLASVAIFSGNPAATLVGAAFDAGGIRLQLDAKDSGTVVLSMAERGASPRRLLSPPIRFTKKSPSSPRPDARIVIETETPAGASKRTVTVGAEAPPAAVEAASRVLRAELEGPPARRRKP